MPTAKADGAMSLATKLAVIMGEVGNVPKNGFNKAQQYRFARESDVVEKLVPLLSANHIYLHSTVTRCEMQELYRTSSGNMMYLTTVWIDFTWIDGDTGESMPAATFVGTGADTGDKGVYKAMTGAEKYAMLKSFLISTGDDPEADEKVDRAVAAAGAATAPKISRAEAPSVGKGGKSDLATDTQIREVFRLAKEQNLHLVDLAALVGKVTDTGIVNLGESDTDAKAAMIKHLKGLSAADAGKVVIALTSMKDPLEEIEPDEEVEEEDIVGA